MAVFPIGGQRVGILTEVQRLDNDGNPVVTEFMEPVTDEITVWWDGCVFEVQTMAASPHRREVQTVEAITTSEVAVVCGPVVGAQIPAVDNNGNPAWLAVSDLTQDRILTNDGRRYVMRGDAVLHKDLRGRPDHAECMCEHQQ